jgi:hypothetical protein
MYGYPIISNAMITGGTRIYSYPTWKLNVNTIISNSINGNILTSNVITLSNNGNYIAAGTYTISVNAFDIGTTTPQAIYGSNTVVVTQNNTLTASSSGNPGSSYYGYPVSITFTGTPTIRHQAKWSLYVNGALYGTTNSSITYHEQFAPPNIYNFVFNLTTDANYTPYTYTTSLVISWPSTSAQGATTTVTTVTTTASTTSIPTTSVTTTIPPAQKSNNITSTISSSSPMQLNLPNVLVTVSIYTTSASSTPITAHIANATQEVSKLAKPQPNYTLISAVNVSINTTAPITALFVENYPCSIPSSLVAPYIYKSNAWLAIPNYTVNATTCTVGFEIPNDPIIGIFQKALPTTVATTSIPTTTPTTIPAPTPTTTSSGLAELAIILIIVVIIVVIAILYLYKLTHAHRKIHDYKH